MKNGKLSFTVFTPANLVTIAGIGITILAYYSILTDNSPLVTVIIYVTAALTDAIDGFIAKNKTVQNFFGGRGISRLGARIDPLRDFLLKGIILCLAYVSGISLIIPIIIIGISIMIFLSFNKKINYINGRVTVLQIGRQLQIIECCLIGIWILIWSLTDDAILFNVAIIILIALIITGIVRALSYKNKLKQLIGTTGSSNELPPAVTLGVSVWWLRHLKTT